MSDTRLTDNIDKMAKWAAGQPDPAQAGGAVAFMLYAAAMVKRDGTAEQKTRVRDIYLSLREPTTDFLTDLQAANDAVCDYMGWPR